MRNEINYYIRTREFEYVEFEDIIDDFKKDLRYNPDKYYNNDNDLYINENNLKKDVIYWYKKQYIHDPNFIEFNKRKSPNFDYYLDCSKKIEIINYYDVHFNQKEFEDFLYNNHFFLSFENIRRGVEPSTIKDDFKFIFLKDDEDLINIYIFPHYKNDRRYQLKNIDFLYLLEKIRNYEIIEKIKDNNAKERYLQRLKFKIMGKFFKDLDFFIENN